MGSEVNGILVAAHELKTPLSLMRQLALSLEDTDDSSTRAHIQSQIISVSERAMRQVNDLTKIARLEDGLFEMEPVSVRGICESVWRELEPLFGYKHKSLHPVYTNRSRLAVANPDLLYSIVYNFCANAMHYSHSDTVSVLSVSDVYEKDTDDGAYAKYKDTDNPQTGARRNLPTKRNPNRIRIGVRDFGPALPAPIWREFRRGYLDRPTAIAMRPGSSGLGLYIASEFARHMHAELGAIRHRDGTSFFIELPISRQASLFRLD